MTSKDCNLELVYISADRTMFEFKDIYNRFPFLAMPTGTVDLKNQLTKDFKVVDMPVLVILNAQTGNLISLNGVEEVSNIPSRDRQFAQDLVNEWKTRKSVPVKPPGAKGGGAAPAASNGAKPAAASSVKASGGKAPEASTSATSGAGVGKKEKKGLLFWKKS
uniref:protein-disulfide reductase n=1 Tax=Entomoneis paludosa TaxID=265537 RepID=A0A7S2VC85_9STRA